MTIEDSFEELEFMLKYWKDRITIYKDKHYSKPEQIIIAIEIINTILKDMQCQMNQEVSSTNSD